MFFQFNNFLFVFFFGFLYISQNQIVKIFRISFNIRKIHVIYALDKFFYSSVNVDFVFFVIKTENVHCFGKMVKHDIYVSGNEQTFRNPQFILLFKKADFIAVPCKLVAQITHARSRNRDFSLGFKIAVL